MIVAEIKGRTKVHKEVQYSVQLCHRHRLHAELSGDVVNVLMLQYILLHLA